MQLEPYLFFDGKCEEALNFYKDSFWRRDRGYLALERDAESAQGPPVTAETENRVMHANFNGPGFSFMASDATPGKTYGEGPMSLSIATTELAEAERVFNNLAAGGNVEMPLTDVLGSEVRNAHRQVRNRLDDQCPNSHLAPR